MATPHTSCYSRLIKSVGIIIAHRPLFSKARSTRMSIIIMIIVGFIVGLIARAIMPGDQNMGIIMTTILGIVGAVVAGFLGQTMGWYAEGEPAGWIASVIGAIIVLFVVGMIARKRA